MRKRDYRERKSASEKEEEEKSLERKKKIREKVAEYRRKYDANQKLRLSEQIERGKLAIKLVENLKSRLGKGLGQSGTEIEKNETSMKLKKFDDLEKMKELCSL